MRHRTRTLIAGGIGVAGLATVMGAFASTGSVAPQKAAASSHREAPLTAEDPAADLTDVYAFRHPEAPDFLTVIANVQPAQDPGAGPMYYTFSKTARYNINIDTDGDARRDVTYEFQFNQRRNVAFLRNTQQGYTLTRIRNGQRDIVARGVTAPNNIGPKSTPKYQQASLLAVGPIQGGGKVFSGQREDPFFGDIGAIFDLLAIRKGVGNEGGGKDFFAGYGVHTMAIQIPIADLNAKNNRVGIYASVDRLPLNLRTGKRRGSYVQTNRLANPLVNEVVIPTDQKDRWNRLSPHQDSEFAPLILKPILAGLINQIYPDVKAPEENRTDLAQIFATGIPDVNFTGETLADLLRIDLSVPPTPRANVNRLGLLAGQMDGFPNGRRLEDDVIDISERAVAGALTRGDQTPPLGDGVDGNDVAFLDTFPYLRGTESGFDNTKGRQKP